MNVRTARAVLALAIIATACSTAPPTSASSVPSPSSSASATPARAATSPTPPPLTFRVGAPQARMVTTLVAFLDAYNAGDVDRALALMTDDVSISDCDYRALRVLSPIGRIAARQWLSDRAADHDRLILDSVVNENPDPASGSHVVAVSYARRTSDTLRALGFPDGIEPRAATKAVFTATDDRLRAFANGPFSGPIDLCKPGP